MKKLIFALVLLLFTYPAFSQNGTQLIEKYIRVKNALVNSDAEAANTAIIDFYNAVKSESTFARQNELLKAADKVVKATDQLEKQRAAFNDLSVVMWQIVKSSDKPDRAVYYQYCPMKKAYWLSFDKGIKNPYYGASMINCGKVVEVKK